MSERMPKPWLHQGTTRMTVITDIVAGQVIQAALLSSDDREST
jgi:hypothetical protein